jgi:hypothetical protein
MICGDTVTAGSAWCGLRGRLFEVRMSFDVCWGRHSELGCLEVWPAGDVAAQSLHLSVGSFRKVGGMRRGRELEDPCTPEIPVAVLEAEAGDSWWSPRAVHE